jgi:NAD(P)-dependent dehydrogenase (short-subunit alcohol dehydrogenase family)
VTGANRGIGAAIAQSLHTAGANVVLTMRTPTDYSLPKEMQASKRCLVLKLDVTSEVEIQESITETISHFGGLDILINNAGVDEPRGILDITAEHLDSIWDVNVKGLIMCTKYASQYMVAKQKGVIVNMSSIAGKEGTAYHTAYTSSKHAVIGITKSLARELAPYNIRVNSICPGLINTRMLKKFFKDYAKLTKTDAETELLKMVAQTPRGKIGEPQDVANLVTFVCSDEAANITGQAISTDGGLLQH